MRGIRFAYPAFPLFSYGFLFRFFPFSAHHSTPIGSATMRRRRLVWNFSPQTLTTHLNLIEQMNIILAIFSPTLCGARSASGKIKHAKPLKALYQYHFRRHSPHLLCVRGQANSIKIQWSRIGTSGRSAGRDFMLISFTNLNDLVSIATRKFFGTRCNNRSQLLSQEFTSNPSLIYSIELMGIESNAITSIRDWK